MAFYVPFLPIPKQSFKRSGIVNFFVVSKTLLTYNIIETIRFSDKLRLSTIKWSRIGIKSRIVISSLFIITGY